MGADCIISTPCGHHSMARTPNTTTHPDDPPPQPGGAAGPAAASAAITALKATGLLLVMSHHFARSIWRGEKRDAPAITQWQLAERVDTFGVAHQYPGLAGAVLEWLATWGFLGVHLFVAASGIGLGLRYARQEPLWGEFLRRRAGKILLPAWMALTVFFVLDAALGRPTDFALLLRKLTMVSFFIEAEFFAIVTPLWYIATIFQLYLLFPWLRQGAARRPGATFAACLVTALAYRHLTQCVDGACAHQYWGHGAALNWLAVFFGGIWLGMRRATTGGPWLPWPAALAATGALWALYALSQQSATLYALGDTAFGIGAVVLAAGFGRGGHAWTRWLEPLARHSYGAYLYHRPVFAMVAWRWSRAVGDAAPLLLAGCVVACAAMVLAIAGISRLARRSKLARSLFFGQ